MYSHDANRNFVYTTPVGPLNCGPKVAILFDEETGTILSHGVPEIVRAKYLAMCEALKPHGLGHSLVFMENPHFTAEFLNDMLDHAGKIKYWWREHAEILGFFCAPTIH